LFSLSLVIFSFTLLDQQMSQKVPDFSKGPGGLVAIIGDEVRNKETNTHTHTHTQTQTQTNRYREKHTDTHTLQHNT
jgi:hypothetical protein